MQPRRRTGSTLASILVLIMFSSLLQSAKTSSQVFEPSDLYVYVRVDMNEEAIALYNVNLTMGLKTIRALSEANWTFKIQLPKWASPNLVLSADMPKLFLENGEKITLKLEEEADYDYLVAEMPPIQADRLNATVRFGLVQRDEVSEDYVGFKLPVLTGFSVMPEYVNFTFLTTGAIREYSYLLRYFNPIFSNTTVVGLWNQYFRTTAVGNVTGKIAFSKSFDRCVIESLVREITVTDQLQIYVKDRLKLKYVGNLYRSEILKISIPTNISQAVKAKDALGLLQTHSGTSTVANTSIITVYSRYSLRPGQKYEATVEYSVPVESMLVNSSWGLTTVLLKGLPNYTDIVNTYSLSVRVEGRKGWKIVMESTVASIEDGEAFSLVLNNAMPDVLVQPIQISFTPTQLEAGKSLSMLLGLLTLLVLMATELFREEARPVQEPKRGFENLVNDLVEALHEKIDYENLLEEVKVKNTIGRVSSKEYRERVGEYERRTSRAEKKILKTIEDVSLRNSKVGEEVKRRYRVFEEINSDSKNMINNTVERFRGGRITRSVFENLTEKYLKENRKRRETAANDVYSALEKLLS